jgi:hypothetical protein
MPAFGVVGNLVEEEVSCGVNEGLEDGRQVSGID